MAEQPQPHPKTDESATKPKSDDELMKIRKSTGGIAEVIEPVQRTVVERTNK